MVHVERTRQVRQLMNLSLANGAGADAQSEVGVVAPSSHGPFRLGGLMFVPPGFLFLAVS